MILATCGKLLVLRLGNDLSNSLLACPRFLSFSFYLILPSFFPWGQAMMFLNVCFQCRIQLFRLMAKHSYSYCFQFLSACLVLIGKSFLVSIRLFVTSGFFLNSTYKVVVWSITFLHIVISSPRWFKPYFGTSFRFSWTRNYPQFAEMRLWTMQIAYLYI